MEFNDYEYLWMPRPENKIPSGILPSFEKKGWIAQYKKNGTGSVLAVSPDKEIVAMNRHNETHKLWQPTKASSEIFQALPGNGWYVFVTELLHSKVKGGPRDTNYIHELLVCDGVYLVGTKFFERQEMLADLFLKGGEAETQSHYVLNPNTWLAKNHTSGFLKMYEDAAKAAAEGVTEDEGVVVKNPKATLAFCTRPTSNVGWQAKCRLPNPNLGF